MKPFRIVFLDAGSVDLGDLDTKGLRQLGRYKAYPNSTLPQALTRASRADAIITNKFIFTESVLKALPGLKLLCVAATGVNNIDLEAAAKRGIAVTNVPGYSTPTVAEHTLCFLLALSHRLPDHHRASMKGEWSRSPHFALLSYRFSDLRGKTLGVVGYGKIGREVARLAKAFGMRIRVVPHIPSRRALAQSDFVTIHCPLNDHTRHLFNRKTLSWMKKGAFLLNLARGPIVDEKAVIRSLNSGRLAGYAADVLDHEPPQPDHPFFKAPLRDKILITPHVAWASFESRQRLMDEIAANIRAFQVGKRRNRVSGER